MTMDRITTRLIAWIASFAILAASLAPSVSHALAAAEAPGSLWAEICSTTGLKFMKVESGHASDSSSTGKHGMHLEDCPFCRIHADSAGLPPASLLVPLVESGAFVLPSLFYQSPRPLFIWAAAQPRAPPAQS